MYAMLITEESLELLETIDPTILENPDHQLVGNYIVLDRTNTPRYVVMAERFEEFFEIKQQYAVNIMKVKKK